MSTGATGGPWSQVLLALAATAATWWLAQQVLTTFSRYGERLEAVVSLIAIAMLLLITNWFFHQVYWKDHLAGFHARKKALMGSVAAGQILGFVLLGFSSVYREGFETVLFLQALVLESGLWTVLEGVAIGAILVMAVGFVTFKLQSRLPFKRMLVGTGILIGAVLLVMVGNTTHALQVVGWLPTHPIRWLTVPYWSGLWFGFYPTWEGVALQISAAVFVIGSYYLAEHKRSRTSRATPSARPLRLLRAPKPVSARSSWIWPPNRTVKRRGLDTNSRVKQVAGPGSCQPPIQEDVRQAHAKLQSSQRRLLAYSIGASSDRVHPLPEAHRLGSKARGLCQDNSPPRKGVISQTIDCAFCLSHLSPVTTQSDAGVTG